MLLKFSIYMSYSVVSLQLISVLFILIEICSVVIMLWTSDCHSYLKYNDSFHVLKLSLIHI